MTTATATTEGIEVVFADGRKGLVPITEIPEIATLANLAGLELPNPYEVVLRDRQGSAVDLPWDFVRHFCDSEYQPWVEGVARGGRQVLGERIPERREAAGLTQEYLATTAGIGRVTLVRIENGKQSPRFEMLIALAGALGQQAGDLLLDTGREL